MTNDEMRVAIAEACGWVSIKNPEIFEWSFIDAQGHGHNEPPDYCNDLNAMAEAEQLIINDDTDGYALFGAYVNALESIVLRDRAQPAVDEFNAWIAFATALQRAEAFLRVKGLWKE